MFHRQESWGGYSSASDDEGVEVNAPTSAGNKADAPSRRVYPIKYQNHTSAYAKVLYDVEGNPLVNDSGVYLNVQTKAMKEAFDTNRLRMIHYMSAEPSYRYFVTSETQLNAFQTHRETGSPDFPKVYHVYLDEDADLNSYFVRKYFVPVQVQVQAQAQAQASRRS